MEVKELQKEQNRLAEKIILQDGFSKIKMIGGADCVHQKNQLIACVVVCEFPSLKLIEKQTFTVHNPLPYHPGFLAYREMPAIIEAFNQLENEPDLILVDDSGILHPRKLGMASHLGLALNKPSLGLTKNLLIGKNEKGKIYLDNQLVGFEVKTHNYASPLYVSPGHLISLGSCLKTLQDCIKPPHKLPEPLHLAHQLARKELRKLAEKKE